MHASVQDFNPAVEPDCMKVSYNLLHVALAILGHLRVCEAGLNEPREGDEAPRFDQ
jgi:hypothetical protein